MSSERGPCCKPVEVDERNRTIMVAGRIELDKGPANEYMLRRMILNETFPEFDFTIIKTS